MANSFCSGSHLVFSVHLKKSNDFLHYLFDMVEIVLKLAKKFPSLRLAKFILFLIFVGLFSFSVTREVLIKSASNAFISVTSFVAMTILIFHLLQKTSFDLQTFLHKHKKFDILIAAFLGVLPGCGGAIMVMTLYVRGAISFSAILATLVATMGDAAFLLIAAKPKAALIILPLTYLVAIITGYTAKCFEKSIAPAFTPRSITMEDSIANNTPRVFYYLWMFLIIPGIIFGAYNAFGKSLSFEFLDHDIVPIISFAGALLSVLIWLFNPASDVQIAECKEKTSSSIVDLTCFVTVWVVVAFVSFDLIDYSTGGKIFDQISFLGPFIPLAAILVGFVPGCGPQIMITTLYIGGHIPMAAQIGNAISNDGDALFPAIAISPKVAILATLYSAIPAVIVSYLWYYFVSNL